MQLEIVTPDRKVIIGETSDVVIPALQGELEALPGHAPYLALLSNSRAYEPAALSIVSFALTWAAMGLIDLITRGRQSVLGGAGH